MKLYHPKYYLGKIFKKQSLTWQAILSSYLINPAWTRKDYKALTEAGYQNCMTVYACINLISKACAGIPWILNQLPRSKREKIKQLEDHPLINMIRRPNPGDGQSAFIEKVIAYFLNAGNSYIETMSPSTGDNKGIPRELYSLRPDRIIIKKGTKQELIGGYEYKIGGEKITFDPTQILHLKTFHPLDDYYGLSPIEAAAKGIDILNMSMEWNYKLLQNDMRPPGVFKLKKSLNEDQYKRLNEEIKQKYSGYEKAGKPLLLEGGVDWSQTSISPKDLDWLNSEKVTMRKICTVFNVPSELLGDSENKTYSNIKEARQGLYTETILPLMDYLRDEFNNWLTPKFGDNLQLEYDRNAIEALREEMGAVYERMKNAWWLYPNERRRECGFPDDPSPEANQMWIPMNFIAMGGKKGEGKQVKSRKLSFWQQKEQKRLLWDNFVIRIKMKEQPFAREVMKYFEEQTEEIRKAIKKFSTIQGIEVDGIFDFETEVERYFKHFRNIYLTSFEYAGEAGMEISKGNLYIPETKQEQKQFMMDEDLIKQIEKIVTVSGETINETSVKKILEKLSEAQAENLTINELAQTLVGKLGEPTYWFGAARSRTIARTEMCNIENKGQLEGYKQAEFVERKGWLCSFVPDSRESHMAADHEYSDNPINLDQPFMVDGELLDCPGDPNGSSGNIINCLCSTYPEVAEIEE